MKFGQVIRGPKASTEHLLGILDFRAIVKVVNAILLLRTTRDPRWIPKDKCVTDWFVTYVKWLQESPTGKYTAARPKYVRL